jgi:glycerol-3-phosphate dehydrogenase
VTAIPHSPPYDVAVIGGGVVGCAVARRLTLDGARVVLVERAPDILAGASKGNSAILHTGFDAPPGSLELACVRRGYAEYLAVRERLNLPLLETGAAVVAWSDAEAAALDGVRERAHANGIDDVRALAPGELAAREPALAGDAVAALLVPGEHVVDPWSAPLAYLTQAVANGADVRRGRGVAGGRFDGARWRLDTTGGPITAGAVVNAAGLFGDRLEARLLGATDFTIQPRKGQFVVFDKAAARLLTTTILPVPGERTKGVVLVRTAFGNLLVGPTAEEQDDRERATVDRPTLEGLIERAARMLPGLRAMPVTATYAGLRPASDDKAYRVRVDPERRYLRLGGIRSTGLTAALGLAAHAAERLAEIGVGGAPLADPLWPEVPNLAEHRPRAWQGPEGGDIVCHCELVTRGEIRRALAGPLGAGDLGGLKRRTRVMLGRCQGFYCGATVAALTAGEFDAPPALDAADG